MITAIVVAISLFSHSPQLPKLIWNILNWVPGLLLIFIGLVNLRSLLLPGQFRPAAIRSALLPGKLRKSSHPLAIVLMGVLFAFVFDSTTQAAAWVYTATTPINIVSALALGLSFSVGMALTGSTDSLVLAWLVRRPTGAEVTFSYRRKLGWILVVISLLTGLYKIVTLLDSKLELGDTILSVVGALFFLAMAGFYVFVIITRRSALKSAGHGFNRCNPPE